MLRTLFGDLYRFVIDLRFFVRGLDLEDYRTQAVVAAANGDARFSDPVSIIEKAAARAVGKREHILVNGLPRLIAKTFGLCIIRIKHLPLTKHGTGLKALRAIFTRQFLVECFFQDRNYICSLFVTSFPAAFRRPELFYCSVSR